MAIPTVRANPPHTTDIQPRTSVTRGFQDTFLALGLFAFCGLISAWFLSQTKRYRPEAAAAEAD